MRRALSLVTVLGLLGCGSRDVAPEYYYYAQAPLPLAACAAQAFGADNPAVQFGQDQAGRTVIVRDGTACGSGGCQPIRDVDAAFEPHPLGTRVEFRRQILRSRVPTPSWDSTLGPAVTACSFQPVPPTPESPAVR